MGTSDILDDMNKNSSQESALHGSRKLKYNVSEEDLRRLHAQGLTNRKMATELDVPHWYIARVLGKFDLPTNGHTRGKNIVVAGLKLCSTCGAWKTLDLFQWIRYGKPDAYRMNYCNSCHRQKGVDRLNSSVEVFLSDKVAKIRGRAKRDGIEFSLTAEDLVRMYTSQKGQCFYTDRLMIAVSGGKRSPDAVSIDRVDNTRGYSPDNVVLCVDRANSIKRDQSLSELSEWMPGWFARVKLWREMGLTCLQVAEGAF